MSFDAVRAYARHILRPLGLRDEGAAPPARRTPALPPSTSAAWHASTHTFLGAANRTVPKSWPLERFGDDPSAIKEDRAYDIVYDPQSAEVRDASAASPDASFWLYERERKPAGARPEEVPAPLLVAKRYTPSQQGAGAAQQPGITLLLLPGMGVPKEICEPLIELMLPQFADAGVHVAEIWALDMPMSGETALANPRGYLYGNEKDIARDVLHFLTAYLPLQPGGKLDEALPYRAPQGDKAQQVTRSNLHVAAHSLGAQSALLIAAHAPELFASLTVFDPAIVPPGKILDGFSKLPNDVFCTMLGERWPSRKALREAVKKNKRMGGWDDRIVDAFVQRGSVEEADGSVKLTAPPRLEWALYFDKETPSHTFDRIPDVRVPLQAVMPARPFATPPKLFQKIFDGLPQPKRLVWVKDTSHQLIYERLDDSAAHIVSFIKERYAAAQSSKARL